jgi:uncharacterized protein
VPTLQGSDIATYGYQLGRAWGLGRKGIDDGVILLLAPTERKVRIEVGRGLEPDLTDAQTSIIIHDRIVPRLEAGDLVAALSDGADAIMAAVPANGGDLANAPKPASHAGAIALILALLAAIGGLIAWVSVRARRRAAKKETDDLAAPLPRSWTSSHRGGVAGDAIRGVDRVRDPNPSTTIVAPIIAGNTGFDEDRRRREDYSSSSSSWPSSSDSSSSSDWGSSSSDSSSGFDSGGGDFGGGGSDSSW